MWNRALDAPTLPPKCERWTFTLQPAPVLRTRFQVNENKGWSFNALDLSSEGQVLEAGFLLDDELAREADDEVLEGARMMLRFDQRESELTKPREKPLTFLSDRARAIACDAGWIAAVFVLDDDTFCFLLDRAQMKIRAQIALKSATNVSLRFAQNHLIVADNLGRILVLDLESGELVRDLRV